MMSAVRTFWHEDQGQDLIEYTLLMAFVALASAALYVHVCRPSVPQPTSA